MAVLGLLNWCSVSSLCAQTDQRYLQKASLTACLAIRSADKYAIFLPAQNISVLFAVIGFGPQKWSRCERIHACWCLLVHASPVGEEEDAGDLVPSG